MLSGAASWHPLAIAAALAGLTLWLNHATRVTPQQDNGGFGHTPDYFVENFQATAFDVEGHPLHLLRAERMVHYMDDDTTSLTEPRYEQHPPGRPVVRARAEKGVVSGNGDHVHFLDGVLVERITPSGQVLEMRTDYLHVTPDAEQMQTNQPLVITQDRSVMTAGGMAADGRAGTLLFRGPVQGTYHGGR